MSKKTVTEGANNPFALGGTSPPSKVVANHIKALNSSVPGTTNLNALFENKIGEELLTKEGLAEKLKYSVSYINKLVKQSKIPYLKNGRCIRFLYSEVLAALKKESTS